MDALLTALGARIDSLALIPTVLGDAIECAANDVQAEPGTGPSSTVAILRVDGDSIEAATLGDSTIMVGLSDGRTERLSDDRMSHVAVGDRERYRERLRAGHGYDEHHQATLGAIQAAERAARNRRAGYWIAEADPRAADQVLIRHYPRTDVAWCVLATDGAQRAFDHLGVEWSDLPDVSADDLRALLDELHQWEAEADPSGILLPRAKRHDDKTVVT